MSERQNEEDAALICGSDQDHAAGVEENDDGEGATACVCVMQQIRDNKTMI